MKIIDRGIAVHAQPDSEFQHNACADICVLPSGRWMLGYRSAATKLSNVQHGMMVISDDEGKSWSRPREPFADVPKVDGKVGRFRALMFTSLGGSRVMATLYWVDYSDPSKPFWDEANEWLLDSRLFNSFSEDEGETWSTPSLVNTGKYNHQPTPITGRGLKLADGQLALLFELNKGAGMTGPWIHKPIIIFSDDDGKTWKDETTTIGTHAADDATYYWDQRCNVLPDGSLMTCYWTFDTKAAIYRNLHFTRSFDHGKTWTAPQDMGIPGQAAQPVGLPDGRIMFAYVDRENTPTIRARLSSDGGKSWPDSTDLIIQQPNVDKQQVGKTNTQDAWDEMEKFTIGLPMAHAVGDDEMIVIYYHGPNIQQSNLEWVRIAADS